MPESGNALKVIMAVELPRCVCVWGSCWVVKHFGLCCVRAIIIQGSCVVTGEW